MLFIILVGSETQRWGGAQRRQLKVIYIIFQRRGAESGRWGEGNRG